MVAQWRLVAQSDSRYLVLTTSTTPICHSHTRHHYHSPPLPLATTVRSAINHSLHEEETKCSHKKARLACWCRWLKQISEVSDAVSVIPKIFLEGLRLYLHDDAGTKTQLKPGVWLKKKRTRTGILWLTWAVEIQLIIFSVSGDDEGTVAANGTTSTAGDFE